MIARELDVTAYDGRQLEHGDGDAPGRSWDRPEPPPWGPG